MDLFFQFDLYASICGNRFNALSNRMLTRIDGREDGERDEVGEEDVEALREALLEDLPVRHGVSRHELLLLLLQQLRVLLIVIPIETLKRK